jgi:hypothetical protein
MSIFAAGGSVGFLLAPVLATPALASLGAGATALFIPPALLIALLLLRDHARRSASAVLPTARRGPDRWAPFAALTAVEVVPMLAGLRLCPGTVAPLGFEVLTGIALNIPFAVLVKLGQDYLPSRPGTAAGVTLGSGLASAASPRRCSG